MDFTRGNSEPKSASSILQALSCRFIGCNILVFVFLAFKIWLCFILFKNPPPGFFETRSGALPAAPSARALDAKIHREKAPEHCVQVKRSLISIFWKSRVHLDCSISTDKIGRIELAESSLQIYAWISSRVIHPVTGVIRISSNHVACPSLSHTISVCQYMLSTYVYISTSFWKYVRVQVTLHTWTL